MDILTTRSTRFLQALYTLTNGDILTTIDYDEHKPELGIDNLTDSQIFEIIQFLTRRSRIRAFIGTRIGLKPSGIDWIKNNS